MSFPPLPSLVWVRFCGLVFRCFLSVGVGVFASVLLRLGGGMAFSSVFFGRLLPYGFPCPLWPVLFALSLSSSFGGLTTPGRGENQREI